MDGLQPPTSRLPCGLCRLSYTGAASVTRRGAAGLHSHGLRGGTVKSGARGPGRTDDLPLTRRVLYQLSYTGSRSAIAWRSAPAKPIRAWPVVRADTMVQEGQGPWTCVALSLAGARRAAAVGRDTEIRTPTGGFGDRSATVIPCPYVLD